MSTQPYRRYTLEEYFDLESSSEEKYEYFDGDVFCMSGASPAHEQTITNLILAVGGKARARGCRVFTAGLRVKVPAASPYRYPDLTALCAAPIYEKIGGIDALTNPELIVEVLSPSTEGYDRGDKFTAYKSVESFREYLLVAQHRPHVSIFRRGEAGVWLHQEFNSLDDRAHLDSLGCDLDLCDVYDGVEFPPSAPHPHERPEDRER